MKKIIALIFLLFVFVSCESVEKERLAGSTYATKVEYEGHEYILFTNACYESIAVVHSPDCPCNHKKDTVYTYVLADEK